MRWFRVREADIPADLRTVFEHYGVGGVQMWQTRKQYQGEDPEGKTRAAALAWLTEQYDRAERKETWSITMEAAIVVLIVFEIVLAIMGLRHSCS
jgi:hypothetical protein